MTMPDVIRLPRLRERPQAELQALGMTRAHAQLMDTILGGMFSTTLTLFGMTVEAIAKSVESIGETIEKSQVPLLALVTILRAKGIVGPDDNIKRIVAEIQAGEAVDALFDPGPYAELRQAVNELLEWLRRCQEENST